MASSWYARAAIERDGHVLAGSYKALGWHKCKMCDDRKLHHIFQQVFDMYRGEVLRMIYSKC
ncbi:hypothetical protein LXL04_037803 [Taraxacum kok-saghyz]